MKSYHSESHSSLSTGTVPDIVTSSGVQETTNVVETMGALPESETILQAMIAAFEGFLYICSRDYRILFHNEAMRQQIGYDAAGEFCYRALHGRESVCPWCVNDKVFAGETVKSVAQGPKNQRWYEISSSPIWNNGVVVSKLGAFVDITERRQAEEALRQGEARNRALFANSMDAVLLSPGSGLISAANGAACAIFGMTEEELCGTNYAALIAAIDQGMVEPVAERARSVKDRSELRFRRKDGTTFLAEVTYIFVGDAYSSFIIIRDISEYHRTKEEIISLNANLEQRVRARTRELEMAIREQESFSHSISHDLRAPLRHINSYSALLAEDYGEAIPTEAHVYLDKIRQATARMGGLIDHLLNLSRVSRTELMPEKVNLTELATSIANMLASEKTQAKVQFVIEKDLVVHGDRILLRQLLQNLLDNACKYSVPKPNPRVEFGRITIGRKKYFYVKDNGVGFDMEYSNKLFNIFQRLHGPEFEGNGIGLATVQRIVHRHGGIIWAESTPDKGATFYFTLSSAGVAQQPIQSTETAILDGPQRHLWPQWE